MTLTARQRMSIRKGVKQALRSRPVKRRRVLGVQKRRPKPTRQQRRNSFRRIARQVIRKFTGSR